jgi:hypothetical protein
MKKQLLLIEIILMLIVVGFSGCTSSPKDKLIGEWISEENEMSDSITFYTNGSAYHRYITILDEEWTNYSITGDRLTLGVVVYTFSLSDDNLILILTDVSENTTRTYDKQ